MNKVKLDEVDHQIVDILIDNTRVPFTDISKRLFISAGTVHVRVKKMEEAGIIKGSSLNLDYVKLGYSFIAYIGIFLEKTKNIVEVIKSLNEIPFVTVAHITTGKFNFFFTKLISSLLVLLKVKMKYLGVKILFLIKIFLEISLSIAIKDANTPECVYLIFSVSNTV